jgi:hypothetical protein
VPQAPSPIMAPFSERYLRKSRIHREPSSLNSRPSIMTDLPE